ncbi:acyltransferase domain-containing protein [Corynebacterium sp. P5848]|uniref:acyltransferase domain-containing protein n=1 Tax=Corynebacterium marambiense TaxID=2765364 RepID=UPI00226101FF|nr:acyltransferase domain-containing protein [Corynebacterium marambiense]MCX7541631.1 acyltransferase domain-containing protein [Corynebacterium marambiense]
MAMTPRLPDGSTLISIPCHCRDVAGQTAAVLSEWLRENPRTDVAALTAALARRRTPGNWIIAVAAGDSAHLARLLDSGPSSPSPGIHVDRATLHKPVFVFPGQGSQRHGMGGHLYDRCTTYAETVDALCSELDRLERSPKISAAVKAYLRGHGDATPPVTVIQPALFMHTAGVAALWRRAGIRPWAVIGHSQGELGAMHEIGALSSGDALSAVRARSRAVAGLSDGSAYAMLFAAANATTVSESAHAVNGFAEVSVVNSPEACCVSGDHHAITELAENLKGRGIFTKVISVDYPAHTCVIDNITDQVIRSPEISGNPTIDPPSTLLLSPTYGGRPLPEGLPLTTFVAENLRNKVAFHPAVCEASAGGADLFIEMGSVPVLAGALRQCLAGHGGTVVAPARNSDPAEAVQSAILETVCLLEVTSPSGDLTPPGGLPAPLPPTVLRRNRFWLPPRHGHTGGGDAPRAPRPDHVVETWERVWHSPLGPATTVVMEGDHPGLAPDILRAELARYGSPRVEHSSSPVRVIPVVPRGGCPVEAAARVVDEAAQVLLKPSSRIIAVTWGAEAVCGSIPHPGSAGAVAALRCLAAEHSLPFRSVDLDPTDPAEQWAADIARAVHTTDEENAVRGGLHFRRRLLPVAVPDAGPPPDTAVVLGGTGHLGWATVRHFAESGTRHIVLASRTRSRHTAGALAALRDSRPECTLEHVTLDAEDPEQLRRLFARFPGSAPHCVVHAAVNYELASGATATADALRGAAGGKARITAALLQALGSAPDTTVLLCSSVSAQFNGAGFAAYCAVNRITDAQATAALPTDVRSVQWGLFTPPTERSDDGYRNVAAAAHGTGLISFEPSDALPTVLPGAPGNRIVAAADWGKFREALALNGRDRLLGGEFDDLDSGHPEPVVEHGRTPDSGDRATSTSPASAVLTALGVSDVDEAQRNIPLVQLGLDSVQAISVRTNLSRDFGMDVSVEELLGAATLDDLDNRQP